MKVSVSFLKSLYSKEETIQKLNYTSCDAIHVDLIDGIYVKEEKNIFILQKIFILIHNIYYHDILHHYNS